MKKIRDILYWGMALLLVACSAGEEENAVPQAGMLTLTTSVSPFEGESITRTNLDGNAFEKDDRIKLKIVCPFSSRTEFGETTYSNTFDALWLLKWNTVGYQWSLLVPKDEVDVAGQYQYTGSYDLFGRYEAQQTPYVYTASTWSENVKFIANSKLYSQYSYIFEADQYTEKNYKKSDLLWAQTYMQTGSYNVHLSFQHVMACLKIIVSGLTLTANAVVTLEGMPDIDQCEVVVGDYYAAKSKVNSGYGYQQKCSCIKANNGKVLGVAVVNDASGRIEVHPMTGNPSNTETTMYNPATSNATHPGNQFTAIANTGVYTAHRNGSTNEFYLIVPPCELSTNAVFWIRDGEKRYSYTLGRTEFEQGKQYPVNITIGN